MLRRLVALTLGVLGAACLQSSPFETDVHARDRTRTNLEALAQRTPPKPFKLVAIGDTHDDYDHLARTVDAINRRTDIELVIIAGDMSDRGLLKELEWSRKIYDRLRVPYLTAIGNHDAISSGADIYKQMFGPLDYRFRFGGIEFVVFNSNSLEFPDQPVPNFSWIDAQLDAARDAEGIVLVTHLPPAFPPARPEGTYDPAAYDRLYAEHDITLTISSHLDDWELWRSQRGNHLQCGTYQTHRLHTIVTLEGKKVSFERCHYDDCVPVTPEDREGLE